MITTKELFEAMYNHEYANLNGYVYVTNIENNIVKSMTKIATKSVVNRIENYSFKNDMFFTPNSFSKNEDNRENSNVLGLYAMFLDIDCQKKGIEEHEALKVLDNELKIEPSAIIRSGHGLHIYFFLKHINLFNKTEEMERLKAVYTKTNKNIAKTFEKIGGDSKATAPSNYLRVPNTYNCKKAPEFIEIIELNEENIYDISEIAEHYYPKNEATKKVVKKSRKKTTKNYGTKIDLKKLNNDRIDDLIKLIQLRNGEVESRHLFLRLCIYLNLNRAFEVNDYFKSKKTESEIKSMLNYYLKKVKEGNAEEQAKYLKMTKWTNEALIKNLNITALEQKELKTIIGIEESRLRDKLRKREVRKLPKLTLKVKKDLSILYVNRFKNILKNEEIAKDLNITDRTVRTLKSKNVNIFETNQDLKYVLVNSKKQSKIINKIAHKNIEDMTKVELKKVINFLDKVA
ncbi:hypothetical protein PWK28_002684 [Enterococcus faecalis]|nr:hypothetical protein [Enterococcus faecalis]